jgi:lysophospholipase L1-like esterase
MLNQTYTLLLFISLFFVNLNGFSQADPCLVSNTFKIVILGSSTAAGSGPSSSDSTWVNRYRNHLQAINPGNEVINLAVGGYNTYRIMPTGFIPPPSRPNPDIIRNITAALAESPDAIIVNMPSNDVASNYSYAEQMFNLDTIVQISNAASVPIWICTTQPRNFSAAQAQLQWDLKDSILAQYSPYAIDFWTGIALPNYFIDPTYDSGDGVHLNDAGHGILEARVIAADILQTIYTAIPTPDPALLSVNSNMSSCGDSTSIFELQTLNFGTNDSIPVSVSFELMHDQLGIMTSDSDVYSLGMISCEIDTIEFTGNTYPAGNYTLTAIISSLTNSDTSNDTLIYQFSTSGHPTWLAINDTLCDPDFAMLSVSIDPQDTVVWYSDLISPTPLAYGSSFITPLVTATSDWYAEVVRGELHYADNILTTNSSTINWNGTMFDLVGHENIEIDSFDIKINTIGTQSVEIYQKAGSYLGFELDATAWTLVDIVTVDVLDPTIQTHVPFSGFSMSTNDTVGIYLQMTDPNSDLSYTNNVPVQTRSTNELTMITGSGVSHNFSNSYFPRDWSGRVYYHFGERLQGDCSSGRFPVTAHINDVQFESIQDTIIDILDTLIITSTSGMSAYQWSDGSNADTLEFVASNYGTGIHIITVFAYDALGCYHEDTVIVAVADLVSLDEKTLNLSAFPNPTTGILQFSNQNIHKVEIFTLSGQKLRELEPNDNQIDLSEYESGFYLLKINTGTRIQVIKILKQDH